MANPSEHAGILSPAQQAAREILSLGPCVGPQREARIAAIIERYYQPLVVATELLLFKAKKEPPPRPTISESKRLTRGMIYCIRSTERERVYRSRRNKHFTVVVRTLDGREPKAR